MITSMPSPRTLRSKSVTRAATSISASASRSSPVISQSIHTSRSFTVGTLLRASQRRALSGRFVSPPRVGGVKDWIGLARPSGPAASGSSPARSSSPTRPRSVRAVRAYDLLPESVVPTVGHLLPVARGRRRRLPRAGAADPGDGGRVGAAVRGVHRRHRRGVGARAADRLRLLRWRRLDADASSKYPWEIARDVGLLLLVGVARRLAAHALVPGLAASSRPAAGGPDGHGRLERNVDVEAQQGR